MIVVLDTNVLVSALLNARGTPGRLIDLAMDKRFQVAISGVLIAEWDEVLTYPRIRNSIRKKASDERLAQFRQDFLGMAILVPNESPVRPWLVRDPDDNWVIQCAITAGAERIVTGDGPLHALQEVEGIKILTPAEFLVELTVD